MQVMDGPHEDSKAVYKLAADGQFYALPTTGPWQIILLKNGTLGWVRKR